ncbi:MAG: hypothetical protein H6669_06105 [Ardenticatenaceae bacterium]|nr:hypothetical protein [Ardenticatenaceae bacterium]
MPKIKNKHVHILLGVCLIAIAVGGILYSNVVFADLSMRSIQKEDLPKDSRIVSDEQVEIDDISHPLSLVELPEGATNIPEGQESLYGYDSAYSFSAFLPDEAVFIANFTYRYSDQVKAKMAADFMSNDLESSAQNVEVLPLITAKDQESHLQGQAFTLMGDEGDSVYWFIGVEDNVLSIVMANGFNDAAVNNVFQSAIGKLVDRFSN